MNAPKYVILFLVMTLTSLLLLDAIVVTEKRATLPENLERAIINAMRSSTHLGALRNHEVQISESRLVENIQTGLDALNLSNVDVTVNTVSENPPLVQAEAQMTRKNIIGTIIPELKLSNVRAETLILGDLIEEGGHE